MSYSEALKVKDFYEKNGFEKNNEYEKAIRIIKWEESVWNYMDI